MLPQTPQLRQTLPLQLNQAPKLRLMQPHRLKNRLPKSQAVGYLLQLKAAKQSIKGADDGFDRLAPGVYLIRGLANGRPLVFWRFCLAAVVIRA